MVQKFSLSLIVLSAVSALLTKWFIGYALRSGIKDIPNERSSHQTPTPRGGGMAIVLTSLGAWIFLILNEQLDPRAGALLCLCSSLIAWIGWKDDQCSIAARTRLAVQFVAAMLFVFLAVPGLEIGMAGLGMMPRVISLFFSVLFLVWMTNLYNFMDGIDGIAASQAITVGLNFAVLLFSMDLVNVVWIFWIIGAAALGFLFFNWQPARIFMGDVASGFLGFTLGAGALLAESSAQNSGDPNAIHQSPMMIFVLLMGVFIVDTGLTLFRRLLAKNKLSQAHRDHAYQKAVQAGSAHQTVTFSVIMINLGWLLPLGVFAAVFPEWAWLALMVSWIPLVALGIHFRAGLTTLAGGPRT